MIRGVFANMANPYYGKWETEDDSNDSIAYGSVPSAEEVALKRMGTNARKIKRYNERKDKMIFKVKALFPGPSNYLEKNPYQRPFTRAEALEIVNKAGLMKVIVMSAYLSGWAGCGYYDPLGQSQVIVVAKGGDKVELYFQYVSKPERWRLVNVRKIS